MLGMASSGEKFMAYYRAADGSVTRPADEAALATALADSDGLLWVDLFTRTESDGAILKDLFDFHPLTIEDCVSPKVDPAKVDDFGSYIFVIVQALTSYSPDKEIEPVEVDFYLGPNYVVSCHREPIPAIEQFANRCDRDDSVLSHTVRLGAARPARRACGRVSAHRGRDRRDAR